MRNQLEATGPDGVIFALRMAKRATAEVLARAEHQKKFGLGSDPDQIERELDIRAFDVISRKFTGKPKTYIGTTTEEQIDLYISIAPHVWSDCFEHGVICLCNLSGPFERSHWRASIAYFRFGNQKLEEAIRISFNNENQPRVPL